MPVSDAAQPNVENLLMPCNPSDMLYGQCITSVSSYYLPGTSSARCADKACLSFLQPNAIVLSFAGGDGCLIV